MVHVISGARSAGGAERVVAALVAGGDIRGWDQLVLNPFSRTSSAEFAALCGETRYDAHSCDHVREMGSLYRWLRRRVTEFEPTIVHAHLFHAEVATAALRRLPGQRRIFTHHSGDAQLTGARRGVQRQLDRWAGRRFDRVVAVSESVKRFLVDDYRYPLSRVVTIPNGWNGCPGPPPAAQSAPTIVSVGVFRPEKGHAVLLSAFELVRRQLPTARLVLVGDGDLRPALAEQVAASGLADSVEMVGTVTDVWPYLSNADVFALASLSESFGMSFVEAMAAGLPVVGPDIGGIPELVTPGVNGELFPPSDAHALARHLIGLLQAPETRQRMGAAGRAVAQSFRMDATVERYFELYETIVNGSSRSTP